MKKIKVIILVSILITSLNLVNAQTARLQVIHNSADLAADPVDVYLWNGTANSLVIKLDDFAFRQATPFVDVPAGDSLAVVFAGSASTSETDQVITTIPVGALAENEKYVVFANGVVDPNSYAVNPDGRSAAFGLLVKTPARESAVDANNVDFFVLHGATDAPTVDVIARGVATLVDNAAYGDITDYISVPAASYILDVTPGSDNNTVVASFQADLSGLAGGSAVVFASGFLDPTANQNGKPFGIFAALANGTVVEFPAYSPTARLQIIHNSADLAADPVDVYLWNGTANSLVIKLDDFAFRQATPFVDVPAGDSLAVVFAGSASTSETDQVITTISVGALAENEKYVVFANGVVDPNSYAANPDGKSTAFGLLVKAPARESAVDANNVDFFVLHGSTDAPTVDVIARGVATIVDNVAYGDISNYINVPAESYILDVTPGSDNNTVVASFQADLSGLAGGSAVVFASGFLDPSANQNGSSFGLYAALVDGSVIPFQSTLTSANETLSGQEIKSYSLLQNYPNPFNPTTKIEFSLPFKQAVSLKVFNLLGQEITTLLNKEMNEGNYKINFDASDLSSGIYVYQLSAGNFVQTRKMTLLK